MYAIDLRTVEELPIKRSPRHSNLLLYCFGRLDSTLLLCPYGRLTGPIKSCEHITHAKIQWSDPERIGHLAKWLNKTVVEFDMHALSVLAMELVTLRDIEPDEKVVLDYDEEWETESNAHIELWRPVARAASYISALKAMLKRYPDNVHVRTRLDVSFTHSTWKTGHILNWVYCLAMFGVWTVDCGDDGNISNATIYTEDDEEEEYSKVRDVPGKAFEFRDVAYTGDFLQHNVSRHDTHIPDLIFQRSWKNRFAR